MGCQVGVQERGTSQIQHIVDAPDISTVGVSLTLGGCGASAARAAAVTALALLPPVLLLQITNSLLLDNLVYRGGGRGGMGLGRAWRRGRGGGGVGEGRGQQNYIPSTSIKVVTRGAERMVCTTEVETTHTTSERRRAW